VGKFIINSNNSSGEPMKLNPLRYLSLSLFVPFLFSTVSVAADIENGERILVQTVQPVTLAVIT